MLSLKAIAEYMLAIVFGLCSMGLVWDLCLKYISGSTTIVREQQQHDYLALPHFLLCMKQRFQDGKLEAMGLPEAFLSKPDGIKLNTKIPFPDLNATWQRATWPMNELDIDWSRYEGKIRRYSNAY